MGTFNRSTGELRSVQKHTLTWEFCKLLTTQFVAPLPFVNNAIRGAIAL